MPRKPPPDVELIRLAETMSYQEIARAYGVHPSTAHETIRRARRRIAHPETIRGRLPEAAELNALAQELDAKAIAARYKTSLGHTQHMIRRSYIALGMKPPALTRKLPEAAELLELSKTLTNRELAERYGSTMGSVAAALAHARQVIGRNPRRTRRRSPRVLPPPAELLELSKTSTQSEIAERYGVSPSYVSAEIRALRRAAGLPPMRRGRPPGAQTQPSYDGPPRDELDDALTRWGLDGVAEEYDVTPAQIAAWMRELDL
jgi:transposase-like protein